MTCPHCHATNPAGAKFCVNCGRSLAATCPDCGATAPPGARFCPDCGVALARPATSAEPSPAGDTAARQASSPAQVQVPLPGAAEPIPTTSPRHRQHIPRELVTKLEAAREAGSMAGERRIVTALFCDVKGSTAMAEQLDPEEWTEVMNGAYEHLIAPVYRYEGTLARLMGDAIVAFFGAPIAHEDDAWRAVLAGQAIVEGIQTYREQVRRERGLEFDVRVGINTGLVVVGEIGSDLHVEYTAMGDAVNLAARMEQTAEPGTVQITANTHRLVASLFDFEPLGAIEVKGKAQPIDAYRVLCPRQRAAPVRGIDGRAQRLPFAVATDER
jgi:class 3 adenylate cyclase